MRSNSSACALRCAICRLSQVCGSRDGSAVQAAGHTAASCPAVIESPLANNVTSTPWRTSPEQRSAICRSRGPSYLGGILWAIGASRARRIKCPSVQTIRVHLNTRRVEILPTLFKPVAAYAHAYAISRSQALLGRVCKLWLAGYTRRYETQRT